MSKSEEFVNTKGRRLVERTKLLVDSHRKTLASLVTTGIAIVGLIETGNFTWVAAVPLILTNLGVYQLSNNQTAVREVYKDPTLEPQTHPSIPRG